MDFETPMAVALRLAEMAASWPLGASLAALTVQGIHAGRRRSALNEALHELRRPLQALVLGVSAREQAALQGSVQMAATALERLEREINGDSVARAQAAMPLRPLLESAVARWRGRAALAGGTVKLCWEAGEATIEGDRCEVAQALDNLVVNAIEHGGPEVVVAARLDSGRLRVAVVDSGRESRPDSRRESPREVIARLCGRRQHGHGLRVVRRVAAVHGGDFHLHSSARGTAAVLELPLVDGADR